MGVASEWHLTPTLPKTSRRCVLPFSQDMPIEVIRLSRTGKILSLLVLFCLALWACHLCSDAKPGLLDDGTSIATARLYERNGWLTQVRLNCEASLKGARFYEVQQAYLGVCQILFGQNLAAWYGLNFAVLFASGGLLFYLIQVTTGSQPAAALATLYFLTSSPVAETVRGNFGKAENLMLLFFFLALAALHKWEVLVAGRQTPACGRRLIAASVLILALLAFILCSVAKESGKLLALVPLLEALAIYWESRKRDVQSSPRAWALLLLGVSGLAASYAVTSFGSANDYLKHYFTLTFSPGHLWAALKFYQRQCPDVVWGVLLLLVPCLHWAWRRNARLPYQPLTLASLVVAAGYLTLLLSFRFQVAYYAFIPAGLLGLCFGGAYATGGRALQIAIAVFIGLSRLYTVPYNFVIAEAQVLFDRVNFAAMEAVERTGSQGKLVVLDISEESQLVQEWNHIGREWFNGNIKMLYGGLDGFTAWRYQSDIRERGRKPTLLSTSFVNGYAPYDIVPGDLIALRAGHIRAGHWIARLTGQTRKGHFAVRVAMPLELKPMPYVLRLVDPAAIRFAGEVGESDAVAPILVDDPFVYKWTFYEVTKTMRYLVRGCQSDGWMEPESSVEVRQSMNHHCLLLLVEIEGWRQFSFPLYLTAVQSGSEISKLVCADKGVYQWKLPLSNVGKISLRSSQWLVPAQIKGSPDQRSLCYRLLDCKLVEDQ